jgi:tight adherence protein B
MSPEVLIAGLTFVAVLTGVLGLYPYLMRAVGRGPRDVGQRIAEEFGGAAGAANPLFAFKNLKLTDDSAGPTRWQRFAGLVERSGLRVAPGQLLIGAGAAGLFLGLAVALWQGNVLIGLGAGVAAFAAPLLYVRRRAKGRDDRLLAQLPDILDLMARFLRSGNSLTQALKEVAREFPDPARLLFERCVGQQELGLAADASLRELAAAAGLTEYRIIVLAILVQQQTGGSLADVCDRLAGVVRERFRVCGMIRALTAEGRMQANILMALPAGLFLIMLVIKPEYAYAMLDQPKLLAGIAVSQTIGILWIRKIINVPF